MDKHKKGVVAFIASRLSQWCGYFHGRTVDLEHRGLKQVRNKQTDGIIRTLDIPRYIIQTERRIIQPTIRSFALSKANFGDFTA